MKANMGSLDRIIRTILGVVLLAVAAVLYFSAQMTIPAIVAGVFGVIMIATSAISFCPLYLPFKISTKK